MGGSKENRHTPGLEHWSIAVKDGKALEKEWRTEIPIPRGGPHRSVMFRFISFHSECKFFDYEDIKNIRNRLLNF